MVWIIASSLRRNEVTFQFGLPVNTHLVCRSPANWPLIRKYLGVDTAR